LQYHNLFETQDILLITGSVLIFGSVITPLQIIGTLFHLVSSLCERSLSFTGYSVALAGLVLFKTSGK
jgi:hypothetical protein